LLKSSHNKKNRIPTVSRHGKLVMFIKLPLKIVFLNYQMITDRNLS